MRAVNAAFMVAIACAMVSYLFAHLLMHRVVSTLVCLLAFLSW